MVIAPKIKEYSVCVIRRKSGVTSGYLNLPQDFLAEPQRRGIDSLLVLYDSMLAAFPHTGQNIERDLLAFFQRHPDLQRLLSKKSE